jgi:hypothetical protein
LNILLGYLNLLPSLPFDGGNALQAILAHRISEHKAMRRVGHLGLVISPSLALYGLFTHNDFYLYFGLIGAVFSAGALLNSGGIKFGEALDDRRAQKEMIELKKRAEARNQAYLGEVSARERERQDKERLRRILEGPDEK